MERIKRYGLALLLCTVGPVVGAIVGVCLAFVIAACVVMDVQGPRGPENG